MRTGDKQHQKLLAEARKYGDSTAPAFCKTCFRHAAHKDYGFRHLTSHNLLKHLVSAHGYKPRHWWQVWK